MDISMVFWNQFTAIKDIRVLSFRNPLITRDHHQNNMFYNSEVPYKLDRIYKSQGHLRPQIINNRQLQVTQNMSAINARSK